MRAGSLAVAAIFAAPAWQIVLLILALISLGTSAVILALGFATTALVRTRPQLLAEAELYRYGEDGGDRRAEQPVDESNHALAALRYLVSRLDNRHFELEAGTDAKPAQAFDDEEARGWRRIA